MTPTRKPLFDLTAADLMSRDVITVSQEMPMEEAARVLTRGQVSGAPVVDGEGRCVGVLSASDFVRRGAIAPGAGGEVPRLVRSCFFVSKHQEADGKEKFLCGLPLGQCPFQREEGPPADGRRLTCSEPHCVCTDWQNVLVEDPPTDNAARYMTRDPVMIAAETPIRKLALLMLDAHIHRLIVVDAEGRPLGIVSSTDLLAAVVSTPPPATNRPPLHPAHVFVGEGG
jgi:CBS domain-containing protein